MTRRWIRHEPDEKENRIALGVALGAAAGVALVTFYLTRLLVSREEMVPLDVRRRGDLEPEGAAPAGRAAQRTGSPRSGGGRV